MSNEIANGLLDRLKIDQEMRNNALESGDTSQWDSSIDEKNAAYLKDVVRRTGWPTISAVGQEASQAAWLLAQHADHDLNFQAECLALMKSLPASEISQANIAYLEDRVLVARGKQQSYGTQFYTQDGALRPRPIQDEEGLEARRATMGLETFTDYRQRMMGKYGNLT
jgi:hypothetical protein